MFCATSFADGKDPLSPPRCPASGRIRAQEAWLMLTRTEILLALQKMGVNGFGELKRCCRAYESYAGVKADSEPKGSHASASLGRSEPRTFR